MKMITSLIPFEFMLITKNLSLNEDDHLTHSFQIHVDHKKPKFE